MENEGKEPPAVVQLRVEIPLWLKVFLILGAFSMLVGGLLVSYVSISTIQRTDKLMRDVGSDK